jgi:hypothetical protein
VRWERREAQGMGATRPRINGGMGLGIGRPRRRWISEEDEERSAMDKVRRKREREVRETVNGHGFAKRTACRCRGR